MYKKVFTGNRVSVIALLLVIIGGGFFVYSVVEGIIVSENAREKDVVVKKTEQIIKMSETFARNYLEQNKRIRESNIEQLKRQAVTLLGDVQVFLQAAIIKKEAEVSQKNLEDIKRKREMLAAFALQRFSAMTKEMLRLKQDVTRMQLNLDNIITEAQENVNSTSGVHSEGLMADNNSDFPDILAKIKSKNIENNKEFRSRGSINTKNELAKLKEMRTFLDDKSTDKNIDVSTVFSALSLDISSLLPKNSIFTITEAGGKVLLSLGGGSTTDLLLPEVARTMIFQVLGRSEQVVLSLQLSMQGIEGGGAAEFSAALQDQISAVFPSENYSGYIFGSEHRLLKFFPESSGMKASIPEPGWHDIKAANISIFYKEAEYTVGGVSYGIGICYEMKNVATVERVYRLIDENPVRSVLLAVLSLVIIFAVIILGIIGWKSSGRLQFQGVGAASAGAGIDIRSIKPELGSLKRLQKLNRGHNVGGSRVLDYTRNQALKELVLRVRGGQSADESEGRTDVNKDSQRYHKSELREYMK